VLLYPAAAGVIARRSGFLMYALQHVAASSAETHTLEQSASGVRQHVAGSLPSLLGQLPGITVDNRGHRYAYFMAAFIAGVGYLWLILL
jgi:hypothetical protein